MEIKKSHIFLEQTTNNIKKMYVIHLKHLLNVIF